MRLIGSLNNVDLARKFSTFLTEEGIENQLEIKQNTDWGSENYGTYLCNIWIIEEDALKRTLQLFSEFQADPKGARFKKGAQPFLGFIPPISAGAPPRPGIDAGAATYAAAPSTKGKQAAQPLSLSGALTFYIILFCSLIFIIELATTPSLPVPANTPAFNHLAIASPVTKNFLYDYPKAYGLLDEFISRYGVEKLQDPSTLPEEGQNLLNLYKQTPYWQGIYPAIVSLAKEEATQPKDLSAPLFERIRSGEIWRLITPIFLHTDIFHILFNMLWLAVLGIQLEHRQGPRRYMLFILLTAAVSNTAQYIMSGPNFLGFSGVLCAMLAFIWVRQAHAPWEGYQLQRSTLTIIGIFIFAMFSLQLLSFALQVAGYEPFSPGVANTAHLSGAAVGALLAFTSTFSWRRPGL